MIRRVIPIVILLLVASAVMGWLRAGTSAGQQPPSADGWEALQYQPPADADYKRMSGQVKASSLLPLSAVAARQVATSVENAVLGPQDVPTFPKVLGNYVRTKTKYVVLLGAEGKNLRAKTGDVLESGWEITSISDLSVTASFDGQEVEVPLIPYLKSAFEKSEEAAMDGSEDPSGNRKPSTPQSRGGGE